MTGAPINLNRARKAKAKTEQTLKAAENRARFGQTKVQKAAAKAAAGKLARAVDDAKRES